MVKKIEKIMNTYREYKIFVNILFLMIFLFPFFANLYLYFLKDKIIYFVVFIFSGTLLGFTAQLYSKEIFIKKVITYILLFFYLDFFITFWLLVLAFGGEQGRFFLNLLETFPGKYLFFSISTKFTAISLIIYSIWLLIYIIFFPKNFFGKKVEKLMKYKKILWVGYLLILFYPAIHYFIFNSKNLLRQFLM